MLIEDFLDEVMGELPKVPFELARRAVVRALDDLCRQAHVWTGDGDDEQLIFLIDGIREYDVDALNGARVISIDSVSVSGMSITPATEGILEERLPGWRTDEASQPLFYTMRRLGVLSFYPMPRNSDGVEVKLVGLFAPSPNIASLPDNLVTQHRYTLIEGAKGNLFMEKGDWQDLKLAAFHQGRFRAMVTDARIDAEKTNVRATDVVRPVRFGG